MMCLTNMQSLLDSFVTLLHLQQKVRLFVYVIVFVCVYAMCLGVCAAKQRHLYCIMHIN